MGSMTNEELQRSTVRIKGGVAYLPVAVRLKVFRQECPEWAILTEPLQISVGDGYAVFRATLMDETGRIRATGTAMETARKFPEFLEKCETKALGRALSMLGFGGDATEYDLSEGDPQRGDVVDAPQPAREPARHQPPKAWPLMDAMNAFGAAARSAGFDVDVIVNGEKKPSKRELGDLVGLVAEWAEWPLVAGWQENPDAWAKAADLVAAFAKSREESGKATG